MSPESLLKNRIFPATTVRTLEMGSKRILLQGLPRNGEGRTVTERQGNDTIPQRTRKPRGEEAKNNQRTVGLIVQLNQPGNSGIQVALL